MDAPPHAAEGLLPDRPRLADHVLARLHRVGEETFVVLFDQRRGVSFQLGMREWVLLSLADGTRDLEGIRLAGAREGANAAPAAIASFLGRLHAEEMLAAGSEPEGRAAPASPAERPVDALAGYRFACDGRGVCCRQYATVVFSQLEATRARALLPTVERGGDRHEWAFTPRHGSIAIPACAVKHVDGACAYLDDAGLCRIHAMGGAHAKPFGCNLFPARFVDDGEAVRVSALVECACVLRSAGQTAGDGLVPGEARSRGELAREVFVEVLPATIALTDAHAVPRDALVAWSRGALELTVADVVAWLWTTADALDRDGALPSPAARCEPVDAAAMLPWLRALRAVLGRVTVEARAWRGPGDVALNALEVMGDAIAALCDDALLGPMLDAGPPQPEAEAFFLRATAHAHQWVAERPLAVQLRNLAMRLTVARALRRFHGAGMLTGEAFEEPVAIVEAMCRGYGVHADARA